MAMFLALIPAAAAGELSQQVISKNAGAAAGYGVGVIGCVIISRRQHRLRVAMWWAQWHRAEAGAAKSSFGA